MQKPGAPGNALGTKLLSGMRVEHGVFAPKPEQSGMFIRLYKKAGMA